MLLPSVVTTSAYAAGSVTSGSPRNERSRRIKPSSYLISPAATSASSTAAKSDGGGGGSGSAVGAGSTASVAGELAPVAAGPPVCAGKPQATAARTNIMNALTEARGGNDHLPLPQIGRKRDGRASPRDSHRKRGMISHLPPGDSCGCEPSSSMSFRGPPFDFAQDGPRNPHDPQGSDSPSVTHRFEMVRGIPRSPSAALGVARNDMGGLGPAAHPHDDPVLHQVPLQRDHPALDRTAIQLHGGDAGWHVIWG